MLKQIYRFLNPRFQNLFLDYKVDFKPRYGHGKPPHQELYAIINTHRNNYRELLSKALSFKENIWTIRDAGTETDETKPVWNNRFLPGLDIIGIYTLLTEFKPEKYIEIGSGNSTKVAYKAISEQKLNTKIISIDPMPRTEIDNLADKIIREPFENIDFSIAEELNENDILFVDNSHRILPNSDSMVFFLELLPKLKKGVIVHIHDIYLPYDYPQFMCDRFYSEQYGLAMYLLANPKKYQTILPNYFISEDKELSGFISPVWEHKNLHGVERHGGSFWIRISE
ncbi:MAG: class I SAM-dependent methyltransferase [Prolixibacteraceae bacterium]|nr:class I SAM-dependent methyltransferase [Prolixibacteraceae bacterium]